MVVDVTPETLQERLKEGKIYSPEKIEKSLENFFQRRHLVALRELALREVADNIEAGANLEIDGHVCSVHERVLVCVYLSQFFATPAPGSKINNSTSC